MASTVAAAKVLERSLGPIDYDGAQDAREGLGHLPSFRRCGLQVRLPGQVRNKRGMTSSQRLSYRRVCAQTRSAAAVRPRYPRLRFLHGLVVGDRPVDRTFGDRPPERSGRSPPPPHRDTDDQHLRQELGGARTDPPPPGRGGTSAPSDMHAGIDATQPLAIIVEQLAKLGREASC